MKVMPSDKYSVTLELVNPLSSEMVLQPCNIIILKTHYFSGFVLILSGSLSSDEARY